MRGASRCELHQLDTKRYDPSRGSPGARGYGHTWRKLRLMVLRQHPTCVDPFGVHGDALVLATDVDHIVSRAQGGTDAMDNLQPLCRSCHSRKTAMSDGRWGRGG